MLSRQSPAGRGFRLRSALIFPGMSLPHRTALLGAPLASGAGAAAAAVVDTDLDLANATASSYSCSTSLHPAAAAGGGFRNDTQPHTPDLGLRWSTPTPTAPCAATERERATRCSRSMRLWTRPSALAPEDEDEGDDAQAHGRGQAQSGHRRRRRSRRQCGHTPPPASGGCPRQRHSPIALARSVFRAGLEGSASARDRGEGGRETRGARLCRSYIRQEDW